MMNNILFTYDLFLSSSGFFVQGLIPFDIENTLSVKTAVISSCPMLDRKSFTGVLSLPVGHLFLKFACPSTEWEPSGNRR